VSGSTASYIGASVGDPLPESPKVTATLFGDHAFALSGQFQASVGATPRHQGSKHASFSGTSVNPDHVMPAYSTPDLRASLRGDRYNLWPAIRQRDR
jgi:hypothetical protein